MKTTKLQRITALILTTVLLICGGVMPAGASDASSNSTPLEHIKELLNASSYKDYFAENSNVPNATEEKIFNAYENYTYVTTGGVTYTADSVIGEDVAKENIAYVGEFDGRKALYTPSSGSVTWKLDGIDTPARYNIRISYYPVENKSASIEREFMINGGVPFSEARYVVISKIWKNVYSDGEFVLDKGEDPQSYIDAAAQVGITAKSENVDGKTIIKYTMPEYWTEETANLVDEKVIRFFTKDIDANEIRSSLVQAPAWSVYTFKDANGFVQEDFQFVIGPDEKTQEVTISLNCVNEPMAIDKIMLVPCEENITYADYLKAYEGVAPGTDKIKIEAEYYSAASSQTIYPISDSTSAITSPSATDRTVLNTLGGDKWQSSGQWIEYSFKVKSSGMYTILTRFKQSVLDGMYTSRALHIFSDKDSALQPGDKGYYNGIPFAEAGKLRFNYSSDWQAGFLTDGTNESFDIYFEAGVEYTIRLEVTLGTMGDIVSRVQKSLDSINSDYLNILKLTGSSPDEYRDYGFSRVMPDTIIDLILQARELSDISEEISKAVSEKSSMTATLDKVARLLEKMRDDDEVAKNLEQLKTYIGTLGTWLGDAKTQPLTLDFVVIQSAADEEVPEAKAGFFKSLWFEIKSFVASFFRNYNRIGAMVETEDIDSVEVWLAYGRDQSQVIRGLINNDYTPHTGITVDLKLVAAGTLLPSVLSGMGPDVYIGIGQSDVINYAIRGALIEIEHREGFEEISKQFNEAAMMVLGIEDVNREMHYYGLPETQNFTMMFIREDIFAELDLNIPKTWEDVKEIIPVLQANNMLIGMTKDENVFLYQLGGELFADGGMRINLDSNVALEAFDTMCEMFTMYSFPYKYDFPNRFRTGEMPIGFATYAATYNQLKVFATEIEGSWGFYPLPGYADESGENINNASVSTVTAISIITGCEDVDSAWSFIKWHSGDQCQVDYSNEMVAILGPSAKHATANTVALRSLPWTAEEYEQLALQFENLAAIPNYPGRYIVERYTQFAFLAAFNDNADPVTEMQSYIKTINTEITRKRQEFGLETLADGQTLAEKRMEEAETKLKEAKESSSYVSAYDSAYNNALALLEGYETEDYASLRALAETLEGLNAGLFGAAAADMRSAANALQSYEAYK